MNGTVILEIDTCDTKTTRVGLERDGVRVGSIAERSPGSSQTVLPAIRKILSDNGITPDELTGIRVATGPGSFTGIRVGVAVARTLGMYLGIPVNGKPATDAIHCIYEGDRWGD